MPTVPLLTPDASPSEGGTPSLGLAVPVDAFGGAVGHALSGVGEAVTGASDKIWARAVELQDLQNKTEVDKADSAYMEKAGILHANFSALQGSDAQQAFPKYIQDLKDARANLRGTLSNPMTQKMFDSTSLSTMGRTIFNGAGHAAEATKNAAIDAVTQRLKTTIDQASNTDDPAQVEALRNKAAGLNWQLHQLRGTPDSADDTEHVINSSLDSNVIIRTAKTDPFAAKTMLDAKKSGLTKEDYDKADNFITSQRRAVGSANTANEIWTAGQGDDSKPEMSEDAMVEMGKKKAAEDAPDDPIYAQHVEAAIHTKYTREKQSERQFTWDNKQEIATSIQNGATSVQEILTDPKAAAAYHNLTPKEQNAVPSQINRYVAAKDYADNQRSMTTLNGLAKNDVLKFLDTDPTDPSLKLSQPQIRTVQNMQAELKKNQNQDPQVNRAMGQLRGAIGSQLQALGIYHRDAKNPDDYDHFTGALSESISAWQSAHGKPPEPKDITDTIAPQLLKQHQEPGMLWGTNTSDPMYKDVLSTDKFKTFADEHAKSRIDAGQPAPTQQETERLYYRGLAQTLYGGSKVKPQ